MLKNYNDKIHLYAIQDFDYLMEVIFRACSCSLPNDLIRPSEYNLPLTFHKWADASTTVKPTPFMTEILNKVLDAFINKKDGASVKLLKASNLAKAGDKLREEKKFIEAKKVYGELINLLTDVLNDKDLLPEDIVTIYKRLCVGYFSMSHIEFEFEKNKIWEEHLKIAIRYFQQGVLYLKENNDSSIKETTKRTLYYNGCCAYSRLCEYIEKVDEETQKEVIACMKEIQKIDYEGEEIRDLMADHDFRFFYDNCKDLIRREIST